MQLSHSPHRFLLFPAGEGVGGSGRAGARPWQRGVSGARLGGGPRRGLRAHGPTGWGGHGEALLLWQRLWTQAGLFPWIPAAAAGVRAVP